MVKNVIIYKSARVATRNQDTLSCADTLISDYTASNSMTKLIYSVGYNSKSKYMAYKNGKKLRMYDVWKDMLRRCYCTKSQEKNPTYISCSVDESWHDYQAFAEWYCGHEFSGLGYQLDKDVLLADNKVYSPENCCFLPKDLNVMLTDSRAARGEYPQGVHLRNDNHKYRAYVSIDGKRKNLGQFDTPEQAYQVYRIAKEAYVKEKALKWKGRVADNVFNALMKWELSA